MPRLHRKHTPTNAQQTHVHAFLDRRMLSLCRSSDELQMQFLYSRLSLPTRVHVASCVRVKDMSGYECVCVRVRV